MEDIIERVFTDPTFITVGIILVVLITLAIFKKLFKFVIIIVLILIMYAGYLYYTGEEAPESLKEAIEGVKEIDLDELKESAEDMLKDAEKKVKEKLK
jgi:Ca2+/Na+ antiporter|tara:strand:+ start:179 stop:472 length:294 start_codon:yes stop_codon:yes gene_type:complete